MTSDMPFSPHPFVTTERFGYMVFGYKVFSAIWSIFGWSQSVSAIPWWYFSYMVFSPIWSILAGQNCLPYIRNALYLIHLREINRHNTQFLEYSLCADCMTDYYPILAVRSGFPSLSNGKGEISLQQSASKLVPSVPSLF